MGGVTALVSKLAKKAKSSRRNRDDSDDNILYKSESSGDEQELVINNKTAIH